MVLGDIPSKPSPHAGKRKDYYLFYKCLISTQVDIGFEFSSLNRTIFLQLTKAMKWQTITHAIWLHLLQGYNII